MSGNTAYKMIELILLFGAVVGFCFWQLRTVTRLQREREQAEADKSQPPEN